MARQDSSKGEEMKKPSRKSINSWWHYKPTKKEKKTTEKEFEERTKLANPPK